MKSYDVCQCGAPLELRERPNPTPKGAEVLLRVLAAGMCHSDLHIWDGYYEIGGGQRMFLKDRGIKLPLTMGHENVGEVVAAGSDAKNIKIGARVLIHPWIGCGECKVCRRGDEQLCLTSRNLGVFTNGGYSDYILVPHPRYLFDIGDLPPERVAPLACSGLTTYGALKKVGDVLKSEPILIFGAGGLGLMCLAILKMMGGRGAIVLDVDAAKREAARQAGALAAIDPRATDVAAQIKAAAGGAVWAALDFVGTSSTVQLGMDSLIKGGKFILVGLFGGDITLPLPLIPMRAITLQGSYVGSLPELAELLDLVRRAGLPPVPIQMRPLAEVNAALNELKAGKIVGRVVLTPA